MIYNHVRQTMSSPNEAPPSHRKIPEIIPTSIAQDSNPLRGVVMSDTEPMIHHMHGYGDR
jgi:hypothetical protein